MKQPRSFIPWLLGFSLFLIGFLLTFLFQKQSPQLASLPVLGQVHDFHLLNEQGKPMTEQDLKGKVWVADFIFSSCTEECPLMNIEMSKLQEAFKQNEQVKLLSFSVDPETDSPQRLFEYAQKFKAIPQKWSFLTGDRESLSHLALEDFHILGEASVSHAHSEHSHNREEQSNSQNTHSALRNPSISQPFLHSQQFVLVDQKLQIRGYYDSRMPNDINRLIQTDLPSLF